MALADWRAIYRGSPVEIDPLYRADVEAGAATLRSVLEKHGGWAKTVAAGQDSEPCPDQSTFSTTTEPLPAAVSRLIVALKVAALARGALGVRWDIVKALAGRISNGAAPALPAGTCDRDILEALADTADLREQSSGALQAGLVQIEREALLSGTEPSTALALAGLFEAERIAQTALVAGALFDAAVGGAGRSAPACLARLRRQPGPMAAASALTALVAPSGSSLGEHVSNRAVALAVADQAQIIGAALDLLRQAGETLAIEANAVTEDRLVSWQTGEIVAAGRYAADAVDVASDMVALALARIGALSARRSAALLERAGNGDACKALSLRPMAASLAAETRVRACPNMLFPTISESRGELPVDALASAQRLLPIAGNVTLLIAVELMASAELRESPGGERASQPLERVSDLLRSRTGAAGGDTLAAPDLAAVADLVRSGAIAEACGIELPSIHSPPPATHLGGRGKRT
jgi:histidine ammonia-lyase